MKKHRFVHFEEATPTMMLQNKCLFRGGPRFVEMGGSITKCDAYKVCLYGMALVITTTHWFAEMEKLKEEDQAWLRANTFCLRVSSRMWVEDSDDEAEASNNAS